MSNTIIVPDEMFENGCDYVQIQGASIRITREQNDRAKLAARKENTRKRAMP